jgi:hypothetical protein
MQSAAVAGAAPSGLLASTNNPLIRPPAPVTPTYGG